MPSLSVEDVPRAVEFYTNYLGFEAVFRNGITFAIVCRDDVELSLSQTAYLRKSLPAAGASSCYCKLSDGIDALYAEYRSYGVSILHPLRDESYGMREFMIADIDGNLINFGQPISASE